MKSMRYLMFLLLALALAACGGSGDSGSADGSAEDQASSPGSDLPNADDPIVVRSLAQNPGPPNEYALIRTNYGDIQLRFFPQQAPIAVANFKGLAASGFYDGLTFHRVIPGFMIQGGDPNGDGTGGRSLWGKPFRDEFDPALVFGRPGLVGMANPNARNANTSQFFITTDEAMFLNNKHTLFAEVMKGMATVDAIQNVPTNEQSRPLEPVTIEKVTIFTE